MDIESAVTALIAADKNAAPFAGLGDWIDIGSPEEGYQVQQAAAQRHAAAGRVRSGYKIGLTSPAVQAVFGAGEPMYGTLYADTLEPVDAAIDLATLCMPKLEGEILLRVGTPPQADADDAALIASLASAHAAFEIADSRVKDWRIGIGEAIADNACCGRFAYVGAGVRADAIDLTMIPMAITADGVAQPLSVGQGSACLGSPLNAYRWLIGKLAEHGGALREGDLILTGALGPMVTMALRTRYHIALQGLGTLTVRT